METPTACGELLKNSSAAWEMTASTSFAGVLECNAFAGDRGTAMKDSMPNVATRRTHRRITFPFQLHRSLTQERVYTLAIQRSYRGPPFQTPTPATENSS